METQPPGIVGAAGVDLLRSLAQRCRDLSEVTAVPEVIRELVSIARELEREADRVAHC